MPEEGFGEGRSGRREGEERKYGTWFKIILGNNIANKTVICEVENIHLQRC